MLTAPKNKLILLQMKEGIGNVHTASIIERPENAISSGPTFFMVAAVGDGVKDINKGDVIMTDRYSGKPFPYKDYLYRLVDAKDILLSVDVNSIASELDTLQ